MDASPGRSSALHSEERERYQALGVETSSILGKGPRVLASTHPIGEERRAAQGVRCERHLRTCFPFIGGLAHVHAGCFKQHTHHLHLPLSAVCVVAHWACVCVCVWGGLHAHVFVRMHARMRGWGSIGVIVWWVGRVRLGSEWEEVET